MSKKNFKSRYFLALLFQFLALLLLFTFTHEIFLKILVTALFTLVNTEQILVTATFYSGACTLPTFKVPGVNHVTFLPVKDFSR